MQRLPGCLKKWMNISVIQPVITKQHQTKKLNEWAALAGSERLISFGGIFPHTDDYKRDIDFVDSLGLKGLKFHAEYQDFTVDGRKMLKIYDYAFSKGLIIMHHAGVDIGMSPPYKSNPKQFANIVDEMRGGVLVAAHLGGLDQWDDVERYLIGKNIYFDTSMGFEFYSHEQFLRIVKAHGSPKILFGSDSPWSCAKAEVEHIKALPLTQSEQENILYKNAKRLLKI